MLLVISLLGVKAWGQNIWNNPITDNDPSFYNPFTIGNVSNSSIIVSGIKRGSGINPNSAQNRYNARDWSTSSIDLNDYFEFTLTPNLNYKINFTSFVYTGQVSAGSPSFEFRSSIDGFTSSIGTPMATGATINLSSSSYQSITSSINFRLYAYGVPAIATTFSVNDFTFNGTVASTEVVNVKTGKNNSSISVYPNPVIDRTINLQLVNQAKGKYAIKLLNQLGQEVYRKELNHIGGSATETLHVGTKISKEIYNLQITADGKLTVERVIVE